MERINKLELYQYIAYFIAFILASIRVGGIHFIILFFIKLLRLDFDNAKIKTLSNELYDLKLFSLLTGIKARNLNDVVFIQECINKGLIHPISFIFSGFFGFAGSKKPNKADYFVISLVAIFCLVMGALAVKQSLISKENYAIYNLSSEERFYINGERILYFNNEKEFDCAAHIKNSDYATLCSYLFDEKKKKIVQNEIKIEEKSRTMFIVIAIFFLATFSILSIGFITFTRSSAKLRKLKLLKIKSLRQRRE